MKRKVLNNFIKQSIFVSLVCASFGGIVGGQQVYADTSSLTETAKTLDIEIDNQTIIPQEDEIKTQNDVLLFVDGNLVSTPDGILNYKDSTYLPLRKIGEALGADVKWYEQEKIAQVDLNGRIVEIFSQHYKSVVTVNGNSEVRDVTAKVDGKEVKLPSILQKGTLYLPTRFVSESLGLNIKWHNSHPETGQKTITIGKETGLNYKKPEVQTLSENNAEYLDYETLDGIVKVKLNNPDWNKFYSQTHHVVKSAKAIDGLYFFSPGSSTLQPVFDLDGDGYIGEGQERLSIAEAKKLNPAYTANSKKISLAMKTEASKYVFANLGHKPPSTPGKESGDMSPDGNWMWTAAGKWMPTRNGAIGNQDSKIMDVAYNTPYRITYTLM